MVRLDKYLALAGVGTRTQVKQMIRKGHILVNGSKVTDAAVKVDESADTILLDGETVKARGMVYYMLNKPAGVVSAVTDRRDRTVIDLLSVSDKRDLAPVGRLDKDTEGLMLITNDGALAHALLSPARHVDKVYQVVAKGRLGDEAVDAFRRGIDIGEKKICKSAELSCLPFESFAVPDTIRVGDWNAGTVTYARVTIREGKFHQVKRMFAAVGSEVLFLRRIQMGTLTLDQKLSPGDWRTLTSAETEALKCGQPENTERITDSVQAVLLDMDGTLVDSMWMWGEIDVAYLSRFSLTVPEGLQSDIEGMGFTETAVYFKDRFHLQDSVEDIKKDWLEMAADFYRNKAPLKTGVEAFLEEMHRQGKKIALATSNAYELAKDCLQARDIDKYFDAIVTACEVKGKPAPDIYLEAARRVGVKPQDCLVFEDIPMGILAGKRAGMRVCAVADSFSEPQIEKIRELADYYIEDYEQVLGGTEEVLT